MYVDGLRRTYPAIDEVWVLGPRDDEERHRRWDLLAFADEDALAAIRANRSVHRADLRLTIVTDGDRFERAWGAPRSGRLSSIRWRVEDLHSASYIGDGAVRETAVRVR